MTTNSSIISLDIDIAPMTTELMTAGKLRELVPPTRRSNNRPLIYAAVQQCFTGTNQDIIRHTQRAAPEVGWRLCCLCSCVSLTGLPQIWHRNILHMHIQVR